MAASSFAVIYDAATLAPRMVVAPDFDWELVDPAYHPAGCEHVRIPAFAFDPDDFRALYAGAKAALPHLAWEV